MRTTIAGPMHRAGALGLLIALVAMPGWANVAKKKAANNPNTIVVQSRNLHVQPIKQHGATAKTASTKMQPPYQKLMAGHLTEWMKASAARSGFEAKRVKQYNTENSNGGNVKFPTFAAAPFTTINNGDSSLTFASVSATFTSGSGAYVDVATVQLDGTLNVILNNGAGTAPTVLPPNTSENVNNPLIAWVAAADLTGSGTQDLIAQDVNNNQIVVWMGNGDGTFGNAITYTVAPTSGADWSNGGAILVGDFNGDGFPDVATLTTYETSGTNGFTTTVTLQTWLNAADGTGNLTTPTNETDATFNDLYYANFGEADVTTTNGTSISGLGFLLFDEGDNNAANEGADVIFVSSNNDGTFSTPIEPTAPLIDDFSLTVSGSFITTDLALTSNGVKGNSKKIVTTKAKSKVKSNGLGPVTNDVVFMTGDGAVYDTPPMTSGFATSFTVLVGANINTFCTNCDVAKRGGHQVALKTTGKSHAKGQASSIPLNVFPIPNQDVLNVADMNGDGVNDLLVYGSAVSYTYLNDADGGFNAPAQVVGAEGGDQQPQPADFDNSGFNSFVWVDFALNQIGLYENFGEYSAADAGTYFAAPAVAGPSSNSGLSYIAQGGYIFTQATADVNGDGLADVMALDWSNSTANGGYPDIVLGINNGLLNGPNETNNFTFTTAISGSQLSGINAAFMEPVAITNTQGVSILLATYSGLYISTAGTNGMFSAPTALPLGVTLDCEPGYVGVGDVNGDGIPDIAVAYGGDASCGGSDSTGSGFFVMTGTSGGGYNTATFYPLGSSLYQVQLGNFGGGASNLDVAASDFDPNTSTYGVYVVPNNGGNSGTFNVASANEVAPNYVVADIIIGDYNSDGNQDLVLATEGQWDNSSSSFVPNSQGVLLIPGTGNYGFGNQQLINVGDYPIWGSLADFNGDGQPDLALTNWVAAGGSGAPYVPLVQVLPNVGGTYGPSMTEIDSMFTDVNSYAYTFTGNYGNTGGTDLMVTGSLNTAEFLNQGANTLVLSASSTTPGQGVPVTITATISFVLSQPAPTGTVTFYLNGSAIGAAPVVCGSSSCTASITTSTLPVGTDVITATYSGDQYHNASSGSITITVSPVTAAFTMSVNPTTLTLAQGATGTSTATITASSTFSGTVALACTGAPALASCTVNPASVTVGPSGTATATVVVTTNGPNGGGTAANHPLIWTGGGITLAGLLMFLVPRRRRLPNMLAIGLALLTIGSAAMISGCGGSGKKTPTGTTPGNYTLTVTGTSGSATQTSTITLTVTE